MCIFCQIINKEKETDFVYQDDKFVAINDINPKAPVHILIIPRNHIESVNRIDENDKILVGELILLAKKVAKKAGIADSGYKLVFNVGRGGGQLIDHLHLHLLGGWQSKDSKKIEV